MMTLKPIQGLTIVLRNAFRDYFLQFLKIPTIRIRRNWICWVYYKDVKITFSTLSSIMDQFFDHHDCWSKIAWQLIKIVSVSSRIIWWLMIGIYQGKLSIRDRWLRFYPNHQSRSHDHIPIIMMWTRNGCRNLSAEKRIYELWVIPLTCLYI